MRRLDGITNALNMNLGKLWEMVRNREAPSAAVHGVKELVTTGRLNNNINLRESTEFNQIVIEATQIPDLMNCMACGLLKKKKKITEWDPCLALHVGLPGFTTRWEYHHLVFLAQWACLSPH